MTVPTSEAAVAELRAENARLRSDLQVVCGAVGEWALGVRTPPWSAGGSPAVHEVGSSEAMAAKVTSLALDGVGVTESSVVLVSPAMRQNLPVWRVETEKRALFVAREGASTVGDLIRDVARCLDLTRGEGR